MIKKQQKWIALLVTLTFIGLLQVSTMPVAAAGAPDQVAAASTEQAPSFIEEEGDPGYQPKKKSIVPVVLIGLGVAAVAAVLILVVFKTKYDITGRWSVSYRWANGTSGTFTMEFVGDKKSGDAKWVIGNNSAKVGEYTVDGKKATWNILIATYTGEFTDKTHMEGNMSNTLSESGTWTAVQTAAAATDNQGDLQGAQGISPRVKK